MEFDCTKEGKNIYFACREKAAKYNDLLNSRERAAELLGISTSTLANHELGVTKNVPPDTVVMMSDLYKTPELRSYYCKHECPIGRNLPLATQVSGLQGITVKILNSLDEDGVRSMKKQLLSIEHCAYMCIHLHDVYKLENACSILPVWFRSGIRVVCFNCSTAG